MSFHLPGEAAVTRQRKLDSKLLEFADAYRANDGFNDVVIKVENEDFPANRLILACYSHYFEAMFTVKMKERCEDIVAINNVDKSSWKLLLNFIYSGNIAINCANVVGLLAAADYLQVDDAKDFCYEFIESVLSVDNCFDILYVSDMYSNARLHKKVFRFISTNFAQVLKSFDIQALCEDDFTSCLLNLNLNFVDNSLLYETVIDWIKVDEERRKHNLSKLLSCLNFSKIPKRFLEQKIATERLIIENLDCAALVLQATIKLLNKEARASPSKIFSIHRDHSSIKVSLICNLSDDVPHNFPDVPVQNISRFCVLNFKEFVYFVGGNMQHQSAVCRLDVSEENVEWEEIAPMLVQRQGMAASMFRNMIVVAGGRDDPNSILNSAEIYDVSQNQWQAISSLNQKRFRHMLVTCEDCVYALGGNNERVSLSSVEKLSDINGEWQVVKPMSTSRFAFAAVTCEGKIYAIGGFKKGYGVLKSVERYCPQSNEWVRVRSMNHKRRGYSACVLQGKIYVAGGLGINNREVNSIECYDPSRDQWNIVGRLDNNHFLHSMFVV